MYGKRNHKISGGPFPRQSKLHLVSEKLRVEFTNYLLYWARKVFLIVYIGQLLSSTAPPFENVNVFNWKPTNKETKTKLKTTTLLWIKLQCFFYNFWALNRVPTEIVVPQPRGNAQDIWRQACTPCSRNEDNLQSSHPTATVLSFYTGFVCKGDFPQHLKRLSLVIHKWKSSLLQLFTQKVRCLFTVFTSINTLMLQILSHSLLAWHFR